VRAVFIAVSALSISLLSSPAIAQVQGPGLMGPSVQTLQATAALRPVATATDATDSSANLATVAVARASKRTGTALMIAGAAALVTGLIIDEDVVTVAGAIAAGVGLFLYLR
jgi:hypothetical protein